MEKKYRITMTESLGFTTQEECDKYNQMVSDLIMSNDDKDKLKFKVGDWVVCGKLVTQITSIENDGYTNSDQGFISFETAKKFHLWTIQDAKDGDVLAWDDSKCIALFKNIYDEDSFNSYGFVGGCTGTFESRQYYHDIEGAHPATKEQRDLLFSKMKEAGYEWDAEKKELKKIHIIDGGKAEMDYCFSKMMNGEKVGPVWSEEDEYWHAFVAELLYGIEDSDKEYETKCRKAVNWLKSLKERIGG